MLKVIVIILLVTCYGILVTESAFAQTCPGGMDPVGGSCPNCTAEEQGGIVPCGRRCDNPETAVMECCPCTLCHLFVLINKIILFIRNVAFMVAAIFIVAGGLMMLLSGAYQGLRERGKTIVSSAVIGLIVIVLSWVIVSSILVMLTGPGASQYFNLQDASFEIQCRP